MIEADGFSAAPAPRRLPASLHVRVLFGGFLRQFGWLFVAFGMLFVWVFDAGSAVVEWVAFRGDIASVTGVSSEWEATNLTVNDRRVYETHYTYSVDGADYTGVSFGSERWVEAGVPVGVEYVPGNPATSRIAGFRSSSAGPTILFVFIFPLVGLGLALGGMGRGWAVRRLLIHGDVARGRLISSEATSTRINNAPVMKLTFEFEPDGGGVHHVIARSHRTARLEDEDFELLVYDSRNPSSAAVLDELPSQPRFSASGELEESAAGMPAALYLLLPGLSAMAILRYLASLA